MASSPARVVIVGGGPGGYESGLVAAQLGADVTIVDTDGLGGSAVLTDCVPSKTLIATAELMTEVSGATELGVNLTDDPDSADRAASRSGVHVDLGRVNARVKQLARDQSDDIARRLEKEGVHVVRGRGRLDGPDRVLVDRAGRRGEPARGGRRTPRHRRRTAHAADRPARRRADPDLGAGLRPDRAAEPPGRGRLRRDRRGVRQRLPRARRRGDPGVEPRPGAARRGRRRGRGPGGGAHPPRDAGAGPLADGVGDAATATPSRSRSPTAAPSRAPTASWRVGSVPNTARPRASRRPASPPTRPASSPSTASRAPPPAGCTPPATAPAC